MIVEKYWNKPLSAIKLDHKNRIVYIIGDPDTGKTTFASYLLNSLVPIFTIGYLDGDPGQTSIGPPCTLALGIYEKGKTDVQLQYPDKMYLKFTGSISPAGHLLETLACINCLADKAASMQVDRFIVDSSGFIHGDQAAMFHYYVIELLRPDYIIDVCRKSISPSFLFNFAESTEIMQMKVSFSAQTKSKEKRKKNREQRFKSYFTNAELISFSYDGLGIHGKDTYRGVIPFFHQHAECINVLIGLCNKNQFVLTIGIIKAINVRKRILTVLSPPFPLEKLRTIHIGSIRCDESGSHG